MFKNYFKTAFRNLVRNKVYSFINIVGLSLGLASAMLIILYIKDEVSYDRFHKNVGNYIVSLRRGSMRMEPRAVRTPIQDIYRGLDSLQMCPVSSPLFV